MLGLAALILAAATANTSPSLASATPWWEKFTFTMTEDGTQQACQYKSSDSIAGASGCGDEDSSTSMKHETSSSTGTYTKITVERRFTPGTAPDPVKLEAGDTLLGGQVMAIAISGTGAVSSCKVVSEAGKMQPPYSCDEARSEKFEARAEGADSEMRHGVMTVLVYGHEEYPV